VTQTQTATQTGYGIARLDEIESSGGWIRIRKHFDVGAYGINAYRPKPGDAESEIIGEHDETQLGHQELYFVLDGHARFTLDGEEVDAPTGTLVFVRDPAVKRRAVAREPETTILAVGATPGKAFTVSPWEEMGDIIPLFNEGEYAEAKRLLEELRERQPDGAGVLYNLACAEARLGETDAALEHLRQAVDGSEQFAEYARTDEDFESIRDDPRFLA
jgi:tetratricopeptide (TPR) repeat protein